MMENSDIYINQRKGEHVAYITKKDISQMEQFSLNEVHGGLLCYARACSSNHSLYDKKIYYML